MFSSTVPRLRSNFLLRIGLLTKLGVLGWLTSADDQSRYNSRGFSSDRQTYQTCILTNSLYPHANPSKFNPPDYSDG